MGVTTATETEGKEGEREREREYKMTHSIGMSENGSLCKSVAHKYAVALTLNQVS